MEENDQLKKQMKSGTVFQGFSEAPITFLPSYKYEQGIVPRVYSQEKFRPPSYCDRVLYRNKPTSKLQLNSYTASTLITTSDHSPVYATFSIGTELRYISVFCVPEADKELIFKKMYVSGRSGSLISKPRLAFYSNFTTHVESKKIKTPALVNPSFDDDSIPVIPAFTSNLEFLRQQVIYIALLDRALGKEVSDSILGYCIVPLQQACQNYATMDGQYTFVADITYKTKIIGKLNGTLRIVASKKQKK